MRTRPDQSRARRVLSVFAGMLAMVIVVALVGIAYYATVNLEELKDRVPHMAGAPRPSTVERAADGAIGFAQEMTEPEPAAPGAATHVFGAQPPVGVDSGPGHWCAPAVIGYRIDPTAAIGAGSTLRMERQRWAAAVAAWTRASGGAYRFEYRGTADYPVHPDQDQYPVDVAAVPADEIALTYATVKGARGSVPGYVRPELGDTLGFAGPGPIAWSSGPDQGEITTGVVVLDAQDAVADLHAVPTPYLHELGHALGLGHVTDGNQVMDVDSAMTELGNGDRTGIRRLAAMRCS